jgi:hypothetical protein
MAAEDQPGVSGALAGLNLIYPGLAQVVQDRPVAAAYVAAEALALVVLFVAFPDWRVLTVVGIFVLTALSILDAVTAGR